MDRRTFLGVGVGIGAGAVLAGCAQGGGGAATPTGDPTNATLRFTWWGNDTRTKLTNAAIAQYMKDFPGVKLSGEPGEWSGYWDKLATQVAANDAPDIIQMDEKYIADYGARGVLLDLEKAGVKTDKFMAGTVDTGRLPKGLFGINAGVNAPTIVANPALFEQAGVAIPDDTSWTWDDLRKTALEVTQKLNKSGTYGAGNLFGQDGLLKAFVRQKGGQQWTADGKIGWKNEDVEEFFTMLMAMQDDKSIQPPSELAEEDTKSMDQSAMAGGRVAMTFLWSNQIKAMDAASGQSMKILRPPAAAASPKWLWYKASMYWSASARSKNPAAAAALVNWLSNTPEAAKILTAERGLPANTECRAAIAGTLEPSDKKVSDFLTSIEKDVTDAGGITPVGGSQFQTVMQRKYQDILFKRATIPDAVKALRDEVQSGLKS
ncbi:extracellular solute-binding protein [Propioniciclava coleopterorum]|uniref:Extracellular solute-binding protein n=1 Tax=Propioniciclava coleopterorum TaxID=2714937 RepID=A0A6G7Y9V7_9ACTN|nr:extracellular solute-binding protein [Propioniciclava coleopterorum]QIK73466.1 extracellular solute-binding protein [Propioniciclava coleopterorum]